MAKVSHNMKGKITMRISLKIETVSLAPEARRVVEERQDVVPANSASLPGYQNALRVMSELVRDASLGLNYREAAIEHAFPSFLHETGFEDFGILEAMEAAERTAFQIFCPDPNWVVLRVNTKRGSKSYWMKFFFFLDSGRLNHIEHP